MASKRRNMFHKNKTQETTEKGRNITPLGVDEDVKELELLKPKEQSISVVKSHSAVYTNINGKTEGHTKTKEEGSYSGKKLLRNWDNLGEVRYGQRLGKSGENGSIQSSVRVPSELSSGNELTIYNTVLKPTWTYGIELWGSARKSNIDTIQSFLSKTLRTIPDAP
ncbi:hypothetical protein AAG570_010335 [Ranatra chinensis]|uniref:Uncharacterized protein n=1 Tax=Ranatra chinensis TaxID=642074 RepID=A0ABD0YM83_9HEMI